MITYADKPWLKRYDPGVPHSLKPYPDSALHDLLRDAARKTPDRALLIASANLPVLGRVGKAVSYREIDETSDALAAALVKMGLQKGDRVVIVMPNSVQFLIAFFGILKAGGVVAATNPTYPAEKMQYQINDCGAKIVITLSLFYDMVVGMQPNTGIEQIIVTNIKEYLPGVASTLFTLAKEKKEGHRIDKRSQDHWLQDLLKQYKGQKPNVQVSGDDLCLFQYTGGTTGVSKAAMATHKALVSNTLMCKAWMFGSEEPTETVFLGAIPFFHSFGIVVVVASAATMGGTIALLPNPRDIGDVLDVIDTYKPQVFPGVPALYNAINNHPLVKNGKVDLSSIRACISGSAPLPPATKAEFERLSGGKLVEGFGMSEAPVATHANPLNGENRTGSIGLPMPDMEMKIVSLEDPDEILPIGEVGELAMHGPQLMTGYHNMPTETDNVLRKDKAGKVWLMTGDIARMDEDGYFYIVDRKKDMALIGGFNVYPRVVEDVLMDHPAILEAGVSTIPHPEKQGQEALKAWVVLHDDQTLTEQELIDFASQKLAAYEVPRRIAFVDELPRSTVGKILRRELAAQEMETQPATPETME
ncbi:MAG: long-chain-fatty-acid--CoA ligase [Anaerolineales bacterium]